MDLHDATALLFGRIEKQDPENVGKIVGFLLLQDHSDKDLIRLAHSPDKVIEEKVQEAQLGLASISPNTSSEQHHHHPLPFTQIPYITNPPASYWNPVIREDQQLPSFGYQDSGAEDYNRLSNQIARVLGIEDHAGSGLQGGEFYYNDPHSISMTRINRQMPMSKTCHYFNKGFCKHGSNCRYLHGSLQDNLSNVFVSSSNGGSSEDHVFSPRSLEKLDSEISEILKSRKGHPISIASLPMVYQEKYGRSLRAEGYLTESQRHGRAGYSLTKLLARLKSIRLFDRPHGQHFVILAEDAAKYSLENHTKDPGPVVAGSRQIYLTFPAESTFTEEDVSNYFSTFGSVEDVRIPCQQKRMFGFVTFSCPNTVKMVLAKGNPHFVCGARVLVKPYREKSKLVERKYIDKTEHSMYYQGRYWDFEPEFHPMPRCGAPRFLRRQLMEERERALELETRRLMELKIAQKPASTPAYTNNNAMEELNASEERSSAERMNHLMDALNNNNGSNGDDQSSSNQAFNLPENPFAPQIPSSIPTAI